MKRRIISLITSLTLLLSLCPAWALAADLETDAGLCAHHQAHTDECGYAEEEGAECAYVCRVCGVEELLAALPESVTPENSDLAEELLGEILELYTGLDEDEQEQLDLSRALELQNQLREDSTPEAIDDGYIFEYGTELKGPRTENSTIPFDDEYLYDVKEYTLTVEPDDNSNETMPAFRIVDGGKVYLRGSGGGVVSTTDAGIVVESGGYLNVTDTDVTVQGKTYGLVIESGARVEISGGTFIGESGTIWVEDGDYSSLLKPGYAWYDDKGNELSASQLANAKTLVVGLGTPVIAWTAVTRSVNYDRSAVESGDLPAITFNGGAMDASTRAELVFFYRKTGETEFTPGLPTNAGTYEIKARLPEKDGAYKAAETESLLTLTINRINAGVTAPTAKTLYYNRKAQELVNEGSAGAAADEGGVILFATSQSGPYSQTIPTGTDAKTYTVWYKMEETTNYNAVAATQIANVKILPKDFTPTVEVNDPSYAYDGSAKNPVITLRDGQAAIENDQYTVTWKNSKNEPVTELKAADTYTATIKSVTGKNYTFNTTATVEITAGEQSALSIEGKPDSVHYGDVIGSLSTSGGIGNGSVKWSVTSGNNIAEIDATTGVLTVKGVGAVTVKAVRSVDNYKPVEAEWSFNALPKEVTAAVTVATKTYDGTNTATVSGVKINPNDLVNGDVVTISGLTGTFGDPNVGANKTVTLSSDSASVGGKDAGKYKVSFPGTAQADIMAKKLTPTVTLSGGNLQGTAGSYSYVFDGTDKTPTVTVTVTDGGTQIAPGEYIVSYSNNRDVGTATVTVSDAEGGNYVIDTVTVNFQIEQAKAELTTTPRAKALTYTGQAQELVDVGVADGGTVVYLAQDGAYKEDIPKGTDAGTYTVWYKVKGDGNHTDTEAKSVQVTIAPKQVVSPVITLGPSSYTYDGNAKEPGVTSVEDQGTVIPASEYIVSYSANINAGTATVTVSNKNGGNYIVDGTADFTIAKANISAGELTAPVGKTELVYTGSAQELISRGGSGCGTMVYSLDNLNFSETVPTGKDVGSYTVSYQVKGDGNHNDSAVYTVEVRIGENVVSNPAITLSADTFKFTGSSQQPAVTVRDDNGLLIDAGQYTVTITKDGSVASPIEVGTYTLTVTAAANNAKYVINSNNTRTFQIVPTEQATISITNTPPEVYYGNTIHLGVSGGTGNGTVTWSVTGGANTSISSGGQLKVLDVGGPIVVTATRKASDNYNDISTSWEFSAQKKAVTAVVSADDKVFDGNVDAVIHVGWDSGALVGDDSIDTSALKGEFENAAVGTNKKVNITGSVTSEKYVVTVPANTTASITPKAASVPGVNGKTDLKYTGGARELVSGGTADGGTIAYSLDGENYNLVIPTGTNAGTYRVWYKVKGDGNHADSAAAYVDVTIEPKTVSSPTIELSGEGLKKDGDTYFYIFDNSEKKPTVTVRDGGVLIPEGEYSVAIPTATNAGTYTVTVTDRDGGNYIVSGSKNFTIRNAQASLTGAPGVRELTYDGSAQALVTAGSAANGTVVYSETQNGTYDGTIPTKKDAGTYTVWYKVEGNENFDDTAAQSLSVTIKPKEIAPLVTAADKKYDGEKTAAVSVSWPGGAVVGGDTLTVAADKVKGEFSTADAGSGKQVNITVETGAVTGETGNYSIKWPAAVTATISRADTALKTRPGAKTLGFDGSEQELVTAGATKDDIGAVEYCLEQNGVYSTDIPKAANAGSYKVWYRVPESVNYMGIAAAYVDVTIGPKEVSNPTIELSGGPFVYDGGVKTPTVTVKDAGTVIPAGEYSAAIPTATNAGTYTVTVTDRDGGNYFVNGTVSFEIEKAGQAALTITGVPASVTYGDSFTLGTSGGSGSGAVRWSVEGGATVSAAGAVTVTGMAFTVKAYKEADGNYEQSAEASEAFTVEKKAVTAVVTAEDRAYDGSTDAVLKVSWPNGALVSGDTIVTSGLVGTFADKNVGEGKKVTITGSVDDSRYDVTFNGETTASISKADLVNVLTANNLTANGTDQELVSVSDIFIAEDTGEITYSLEEEGTYSTEIPKGNDAGLYTVWYKVEGSDNCNGIELASIEVRIKAPVSESPGGGSGGGEAAGGGESSPVAEEAGVLSAPVAASVSNGAATSVMSAASGRNLVSAAVANKSTNVVVKPEISGDVSKTEVAMPASALSQLGSQTSADLTVATPVASVTLPNASLESLSSDRGTVSVATEQVENSYTLTVSADGERVDSVPGGVTLTVPVAEPAPGTVAVLVNEDGTRETIRKAVPADGELSIPLDGSATVEIVDNSKSFDDVAETDWEADAVAFASAHELFNGTSESTFSPDAPMSRAMLTMVLYNLEGRPDRGEAGEFDDVSAGSWYADSVAWATEKGITNGAGDGQFAPDESVTREQFAVMLWRYAGSPAADGELGFTDADEASGYALEALRWAAEKGIMNGYGDGRLNPGGLATRAEAAQMLKNFMQKAM